MIAQDANYLRFAERACPQTYTSFPVVGLHSSPEEIQGLTSHQFTLTPPPTSLHSTEIIFAARLIGDKAQSAVSYWWPRLWEGSPHGAHYYLRLPKKFEKPIITDLLKMGFGPKDAVRAKGSCRMSRNYGSNLDFHHGIRWI